jgi:hypothetical protein
VDAQNRLDPCEQGTVAGFIPGRLTSLQGRLARPWWGALGAWAVLCGALASDHLRWQGDTLLTLLLVLLLAELAWGSLWDLAAGTDWFRPLAEHWPPERPASWPGLPYTQPGSPGGRLVRGLNRFVGWWRDAFWPAHALAVVGAVAAGVLAVVMGLLLPGRLRPLYAALVALLGLGVARRYRRRDTLAAQALVQVALGWLAGHLAFATMSVASLALALAFAAAALGALQVEEGHRRGLWLLNGGQVAAILWLVALGQPLAAGLMGLLLLGQVALQPGLWLAGERARVVRRTWPWMMAMMLAAAVAVP